MERETGIEPATNSLEGCDSTTELLPPLALRQFPLLIAAILFVLVFHQSSNAAQLVPQTLQESLALRCEA
jgi:hypothetical protein